jgi:hypothetical protein
MVLHRSASCSDQGAALVPRSGVQTKTAESGAGALGTSQPRKKSGHASLSVRAGIRRANDPAALPRSGRPDAAPRLRASELVQFDYCGERELNATASGTRPLPSDWSTSAASSETIAAMLSRTTSNSGPNRSRRSETVMSAAMATRLLRDEPALQRYSPYRFHHDRSPRARPARPG